MELQTNTTKQLQQLNIVFTYFSLLTTSDQSDLFSERKVFFFKCLTNWLPTSGWNFSFGLFLTFLKDQLSNSFLKILPNSHFLPHILPN